MDTGKAIFLGLALIALAIFATDAMRPATAAQGEVGRYMGVTAGNLPAAIWVVDTNTGAVRFCLSQKVMESPKGCEEWLK